MTTMRHKPPRFGLDPSTEQFLDMIGVKLTADQEEVLAHEAGAASERRAYRPASAKYALPANSQVQLLCVRCGHRARASFFPLAADSRHDRRCPSCSSTALDTSALRAVVPNYCYGRRNKLEAT